MQHLPATAPNSPISPITHYENFPVASILCPPRLRPPIAAIYHFARTADDAVEQWRGFLRDQVSTASGGSAAAHKGGR